MEKKGAFDYILLETTGLADPGNLAPLFWVDEGLGSTIYLDGIVTLIDAKNVLKSLDDPTQETIQHDEHDGHYGPIMTTAHLQISHADVLVINKSDLVSEAELAAVKERVQAINGLAKLHVTSQGKVPHLDGLLLDLHAYDNVGELDVASKGHSHLDPVSLAHLIMLCLLTDILQSISTVTLEVPVFHEEKLPKLDEWLRSILWDSTLINVAEGVNAFEVHRLKARIVLSNGQTKIVQGVREVFEILNAPDSSLQSEPNPTGKVVLIGRGLSEPAFKLSFVNTVIA